MLIIDNVKSIVAYTFDVVEDQITLDTNFLESFDADYYDMMMLRLHLWQTFESDISEKVVMETFHTVRDVVEYLQTQFNNDDLGNGGETKIADS